jgi:hypothetical protein
MVENSEQSAVKTAELNAEIKKLKARLAELEHDDEDEGPISEDTKERLRALPEEGVEEAGRLLRGLAYAGVENIRSTADSLAVGVDELVKRLDRRKRGHARQHKDEPRNATADLDDVVAAVATGLDRALSGTSRVIDRFIEEYRRPDAKERKTAKG